MDEDLILECRGAGRQFMCRECWNAIPDGARANVWKAWRAMVASQIRQDGRGRSHELEFHQCVNTAVYFAIKAKKHEISEFFDGGLVGGQENLLLCS